MQDFRELLVWQKAHSLALAVYREIEIFPRREAYGLTSQIRRAAVSVPSNISEGCGRGGWPELINFCQIAFGSLSELEYQLILARDLRYLSPGAFEELSSSTAEAKRMLASFLAVLRRQSGKPRTPTKSAVRPTAATTVAAAAAGALTN
jgi:four helix bundle protein